MSEFQRRRQFLEERVVSASGHSSTLRSLKSNSEDLHHLASENVQEPARDCVEVVVSGANGNVLSERRRTASVMTKRGRNPSTSDKKKKLLRRLQGTIHFEKTHSAFNVSNSHHRNSALEIPLDFCKRYGSRLHSHVQLQGIREESQVRSMACSRTHANPRRHYLRAEWRDFADENKLEAGQELLFTLTADSFFVVRKLLPPSTGGRV